MEYVNIKGEIDNTGISITYNNTQEMVFCGSNYIGFSYRDATQKRLKAIGLDPKVLALKTALGCKANNRIDFSILEWDNKEDKEYIIDWFIGHLKSIGCRVEGTFIK